MRVGRGAACADEGEGPVSVDAVVLRSMDKEYAVLPQPDRRCARDVVLRLVPCRDPMKRRCSIKRCMVEVMRRTRNGEELCNSRV